MLVCWILHLFWGFSAFTTAPCRFSLPGTRPCKIPLFCCPQLFGHTWLLAKLPRAESCQHPTLPGAPAPLPNPLRTTGVTAARFTPAAQTTVYRKILLLVPYMTQSFPAHLSKTVRTNTTETIFACGCRARAVLVLSRAHACLVENLQGVS